VAVPAEQGGQHPAHRAAADDGHVEHLVTAHGGSPSSDQVIKKSPMI
jgi:hypothetical protein